MSLRAQCRQILRSIVNQIVGLHRAWRSVAARPPLFDLQPLEQRVFLSAYPHIAPDSSNSDSTVHHGNAFVLDLNANTDDYPGWGQWSINWGDGNSDSPNGWSSVVSHTYDTGPNDYAITASYTDGSQNYYSADANVNVHVFGDPPSPITASPSISGGTSTVDEGSNFDLTLAPNTNDDPWADHWLVNWGDASAVQTVSGTAPAVSHTFASSPTNYSISAAYMTGDSVPHTAAPFSLQVNDVPPMITLSDNFYHYKTATDGYGQGQAVEGSPFQLNLSAYDPGQQPIASWDINWGDSHTDTLSGNPSNVSHVYGRGNTTYTLTATAHQGTSTYSVSWSAKTSDVGPSLLVTRPASVVEGTPYTLTLNAAEPSLSTATVHTWTLNWGDGSTSVLNSSDPQFAPSYVFPPNLQVQHPYSGSASSYALSVTATDEDNTYSAQLNNDSQFGNGRVQTDIGTHTYDQGYNSIVQPDGKVLTLASSNGSLVVLRYKADGSLDTNDGFGSDASHSSGIITTPYSLYSYDYSNAMALQPDGKILVVGQIGNPSLFYGYQNCFIARFDADGSHDDSFGTNGQVAADYINGVALQSDGKIIARGLNSSWQTVLSRYNTNGTIDHDFAPDVADANGVEPVNGGANWQLWPTMTDTMLIEPDDSIILAGGRFSLSMAHYSADGILDPSFGSSGYVNIGYNAAASVTAIAMQGDRILLAGTVNAYSYYGYVGNFWIGRFNLDGSTDHSFASPYGTVTTDFGSFSTPTDDQVRGLGILSDGTILLGGSSNNLINGATLAFVRYNADGTLDSDFGTGGKLVTGSAQSINRVITLPDDRIMAVGTANGNVTNQDVLLGSFLKDNKVYTFSGSGSNVTAVEGTDTGSITVAQFTNGMSASASAFAASINWGDGNISAGTIVANGAGAWAVHGNHAYAAAGSYTLHVTISETAGLSLTTTSTATVAEPPPATLSADVVSPTEVYLNWTEVSSTTVTGYKLYSSKDGAPFLFLAGIPAGSSSYSATDQTTGSTYTYRITTDGSAGESGATIDGGGAVTVNYITVTALDISAVAGQAFSGTVANFSSTNLATPASQFTVSIDWGDGTTSSGTVSGSNGSFTLTGTHTYADPDVAPVTVLVGDGTMAPTPGQSTATITDAAPTIDTAVSADVDQPSGSVVLTVLGADDIGEDDLTYTWSATGAGTATFDENGDNSAKTTSAVVETAGTYHFQVNITNEFDQSVSAGVDVTFDQVFSDVRVTPSDDTLSVADGHTQQFTATALDQFGNSMASQPGFTWSVDSGPGSVDSSGLYTAPSYAIGNAVISASAPDGNSEDISAAASAKITSPIVFAATGAADDEIDLTIPPAAPGEHQKLEIQGPGDDNFHMISMPSASTSDPSIFPFGGLAAATQYDFRLRTDSDGTTSYLTTHGVTLSVSGAPGAPTGLTGTATMDGFGNHAVNLSWSAPAGPSPGYYNIEVRYNPPVRGEGTEWELMNQTSTAGFHQYQIEPGVTAQLRVRAINGSGESKPSDIFTLGIPGSRDVPPTVGRPAKQPDGTLQMSWTFNSSNPGWTIFIAAWDGSAAYPIQHTPLSNNTSYTIPLSEMPTDPQFSGGYRVAMSAGGNSTTFPSPLSNWQYLNSDGTIAVPTAPTNLTATPYEDDSTPENTGVRLLWDNTSKNENGFSVERSADGGSSYTPLAVVDADASSYLDTSVSGGVSYLYRVGSEINGGTPSYSNTTSAEFPATPTDFTVEADNDSDTVDLSWTDTADDEDGFFVEWSKDGNSFFAVNTVNATSSTNGGYSYVDDTPDILATNIYRVVAYRAAVTSDSDPLQSMPTSTRADRPVQAPIATDDTQAVNVDDGLAPYVATLGHTVTVNAADGVLGNDIDVQGLTLQIASHTNPSSGTLTLNSDGSFTYTPIAGFSGTDSFTYINTNGVLNSQPATVNIEVASRPVRAVPDYYKVDATNTLTEPAGAIGANDSNPDDSPVTYVLDSVPLHGRVTLNADGSFTYATGTYVGLDRFTYHVNDMVSNSNTTTVVLAVGPASYTVPAGTDDPAASVQHFPNELKGLWDSYKASKARLTDVAEDMVVLGQITDQLKSLDPSTDVATQLVDLGIAKLDQAYAAYDKYVAQLSETLTEAGYFGEVHWAQELYDPTVMNKINALPLEVLGLKANSGQLARMQAGLAEFASGANFVMEQGKFAVELATSAHDVLEKFIQVGSIASLGAVGIVAGAEILVKEGCTAFMVAAAKQAVSLGAALAVNYAISASANYLAEICGVDPDYMRIAGDAVQVFFLAKAAKHAREAAGANCFAGNTIVQTADGAIAIDQITPGQRVLTQVTEGPQDGGPIASGANITQVDPATWRLVSFQMPDPITPSDDYEMKLLEPMNWIGANSVQVGHFIDLDFPELQLHGFAEVESIEACPSVENGRGQVVLGTFEHVSNVVDVNLVGESTPLQVTPGHKLWSLDRDGWVEARSLVYGERLAGENGPVIVSSVRPDAESMSVYNLDVENDHRYLVTDLGIMAHNANRCNAVNSLNRTRTEPDWARGRLRAVMEKQYGAAMDGMEAHHGIPLELLNNPEVGPIIERAAQEGFDINGLENGVIAPEDHGPHRLYTDFVEEWILKARGDATGTGGAKALLEMIVEDCRQSVDFWFD